MTGTLWKIHSWAGLISGLGLLVIGLTGSLLVFKDELDGVIDPHLFRVDAKGAERLPYQKLYESAAKETNGYTIASWALNTPPGSADQFYVFKGDGKDHEDWAMMSINPHTGEVLCKPIHGGGTVMSWLLELHYTLLADHIGMFISGLLAVALCILGLSGFYLYRNFWRAFFTLRWKSSARILFSDVHKMVGIPAVLFGLILGFTGAYWNLVHVAEDLMAVEMPETKPPVLPANFSIDDSIKKAESAMPGFKANYLSLPSPFADSVMFWGRMPTSNFLRSDYGSLVTLDPATSDTKLKMNVAEQGLWTQFTDLFRALHYGNFAGLPMKIIYCIGGLTPGILAITGTLIWWSRTRRKTQSKPNANNATASKPVEEKEEILA